MKIVVTGVTGTAGSQVVKKALEDSDVSTVLAIGRRPPDIQHDKLRVLVHDNFLDYSKLESELSLYDACIWCLGISQTQVSKKEYETITYDYTIEFAKTLLKVNPNSTFVFLSGSGADSSEKSRTLFARIKGKTENELKKLGFKNLYIARPGGIRPAAGGINPKTSFLNKLMLPLFPLLERLAPAFVIRAEELAQAMLNQAKHRNEKVILENAELKSLAKVK